MSVSKDSKTGKWMAQVRVKDWSGRVTHKKKRGFATKKEALDWEQGLKRRSRLSPDIRFEDFAALYLADRASRLKTSTMETKRMIVRSKILPYFTGMPLNAIGPAEIRFWQTELAGKENARGKAYSPTYLRSVFGQLSAMFNYAVRYYEIERNPCLATDSMGSKQAKEMNFWTHEEFLRFIETQEGDAYAMFMTLFYAGIREGELLALTAEDIDWEKKQIRICKTYQRLRGKDLITSPKTPKSNRTVAIPGLLCDCLKVHVERVRPEAGERLFPHTKHYLYSRLRRGCRNAGLPQIRVHDLRHSHASLLVELGFSPLLIAERLGHERVQTTMETYSHLYPDKQKEVANRLDELGEGPQG